MSTDAIVLLKSDHRHPQGLQRLRRPARTPMRRRARSSTASSSCSRCTPTSRTRSCTRGSASLLPEVEDDVLESYEEHHVADVLVMGSPR